MPKPSTFPSILDGALQINISKLKGWGYLQDGQIKSGILNWSTNGNPTGRISIVVNNQKICPYIDLDYKYNDEPRKYKISLISKPSNLNKGLLWYFICPQTNKYCRKLYLIGGYFFHREAFTGCMYQKQTESKNYRQLDKTLGAYFRSDELYSQLYKKHFKRMYAGKPTKKYLRIMEKIQKAESTPNHEIERAFLL